MYEYTSALHLLLTVAGNSLDVEDGLLSKSAEEEMEVSWHLVSE